jgi:hypothetical protein
MIAVLVPRTRWSVQRSENDAPQIWDRHKVNI